MVRIWVDDLRPMPAGYAYFCHSVNEAIRVLSSVPETEQIFLDLDHDAGDYASDGGDYIRLLDYIEANGLNNTDRFTFRIHSMNIVGRQNMLLIIETRGWKYQF